MTTTLHSAIEAKNRKKKVVEFSGVQQGHVALFWKNQVISGECRFTAIKTKEKGGDAIFEIHLIKTI